MKNAILTIAAAATAVSMSLAPAVSAAETEQRTTAVNYTDLDLSTAQGTQELDRRIDRAAQRVCNMDGHEVGTRVRSREARQCYQDAKRTLNQHFAQIKRDANLGG